MKYLIILFCLSIFSFSIIAQETAEESIEVQGQSELVLDAEHASITVETWDNDYVLFVRTVDINDSDNNDAFNYEIDKNDSRIKVSSYIDDDKIDNRVIRRGKDCNTVVYNSGKNIDVSSDDSNIDYGSRINVDLVFKIPKNFKLKTTSEYGGTKIIEPHNETIVENTYASVDVICSHDDVPRLNLSSTYAQVDLTLPPGVSANLSMNTDYGKMYTDFSYESSSNTKNRMHGSSLRTKLNGGGSKVNLSSGYANIYLRKM